MSFIQSLHLSMPQCQITFSIYDVVKSGGIAKIKIVEVRWSAWLSNTLSTNEQIHPPIEDGNEKKMWLIICIPLSIYFISLFNKSFYSVSSSFQSFIFHVLHFKSSQFFIFSKLKFYLFSLISNLLCFIFWKLVHIMKTSSILFISNGEDMSKAASPGQILDIDLSYTQDQNS